MEPETHFQLTSSAFAEGGPIPVKYSCKGENVSPPLIVRDVPAEAISLALIMHDPDAPVGDFLHWTIWNLKTDLPFLSENEVPDGSLQGVNGAGQIGYAGPCPPSGTHHYIFDLYALDALLNLPNGANRQAVEAAVTEHQLAKATLMATFSNK
jgi:Raf kinase inhibitor-like YbhB/YbcL family protein